MLGGKSVFWNTHTHTPPPRNDPLPPDSGFDPHNMYMFHLTSYGTNNDIIPVVGICISSINIFVTVRSVHERMIFFISQIVVPVLLQMYGSLLRNLPYPIRANPSLKRTILYTTIAIIRNY